MDLALHLGRTVDELEREMTGVEFVLWQRYASRRMLPWRRMELYLAQVAHTISVVMGGNAQSKLSDFLFDSLDAEDGADEDPVEFFAFAPRKPVVKEE